MKVEDIKLAFETNVKLAGTLQTIVKDYQTLKQKFDSLQNSAARLSTDYDGMVKIGQSVGFEMPSEVKIAGDFFKKIETISL